MMPIIVKKWLVVAHPSVVIAARAVKNCPEKDPEVSQRKRR